MHPVFTGKGAQLSRALYLREMEKTARVLGKLIDKMQINCYYLRKKLSYYVLFLIRMDVKVPLFLAADCPYSNDISNVHFLQQALLFILCLGSRKGVNKYRA